MSNDWNTHRTAVTIFAVALTFALIAAFIATLEHVDIRLANEEAQRVQLAWRSRMPPSIERPVSPFGIECHNPHRSGS